ncbi:MAG TPA: FHA domain-containing protein [Thermoanaerobaculia bacterium]|nr:FHA domain-containing protein [Thermoanaerobaculia bacterium]
MQVILQGSLRQFPLAELLPFVGRRTESGTLDVETTGRRTRIFFAAGKLTWAETAKTADPLEAALEVFDWTSGSFTLLDSAVLPEGASPVDLAIEVLLEEVKRRAEAGSFPDTTLFRVVDDPALQQQVSLTGDQLRLLFRLAAGRSFKELISDLGVPREELAERLQQLQGIGLIQIVREEVPEPPPSSASAEPTAPQMKVQMKTQARRRTLVGSLTPDGAPDNVFPLLDAEATIGRAPSNALSISDGSVSSHHARIIRTAEGFFLEDLQSRNGTFVNGEKVTTEKRLLADGDLIRVGKVIMTFNIARESKASETTMPEMRL